MSKLPPMRLLIADTPDKGAEEIVSLLEKNRIPVMPRHVADKAELFESLRMRAWDMVLMHEEAPEFDVKECLQCLRESRLHTALVVLAARAIDLPLITQAWRQGLAGLVSLASPEHAFMTIGREFIAVQNRRRKQELARENMELTERCTLLLESSSTAIAYVHEGMHVYANASYLEAFGFSDMSDAMSTPFIDLVNEAHREALRERLKSLREGNTGGSAEILALRADGGEFKAALQFGRALYEGERCLQVLVETAGAPPLAAPQPSPGTATAPVSEAAARQVPAASPPPAVKVRPLPAKKESQAERSPADRVRLQEAVSDALSHNEASLHFYPVIAIEDIVAEFYEMEVSLRAKDSSRLGRADWVAAVNEEPLGRKLDRWAIEKALRELADHNKRGEALQFILPVTAASLCDKSFPDWLAGMLSQHRLDGRALALDFRLADLLAHASEAEMMAGKLHAQGLRLCVSGVTETAPLLGSPAARHASLVKLEGEMALKTGEDEGCRRALAQMAERLHEKAMKIIVPGVNDTRLLSALWNAGIDLVQGNLLPVLDNGADLADLALTSAGAGEPAAALAGR